MKERERKRTQVCMSCDSGAPEEPTVAVLEGGRGVLGPEGSMEIG